MSGFNLDNYKTVPERITEAKKAYPEGRFQSEILYWNEQGVAVKARFFRTADDPTPGEGMAWEPVPGKTPYTKDSELQNAETSAWGRALVAAFVVDASKGIASREEVAARQTPAPRSRRQNPPTATETAPANVDSETGEIDLEAKQWEARQKLRLLEALGGDKAKAKSEWESIVAVVGATDPRVAEFREAVEDHIGLTLVALPPDQAPFA